MKSRANRDFVSFSNKHTHITKHNFCCVPLFANFTISAAPCTVRQTKNATTTSAEKLPVENMNHKQIAHTLSVADVGLVLLFSPAAPPRLWEGSFFNLSRGGRVPREERFHGGPFYCTANINNLYNFARSFVSKPWEAVGVELKRGQGVKEHRKSRPRSDHGSTCDAVARVRCRGGTALLLPANRMAY